MSNFVGVRASLDVLFGPSFLSGLKRDALLLDRIAIPNLKRTLLQSSKAKTPILQENLQEMQFLHDQEVLFEAPDIIGMKQPILGGIFESQVHELKRLAYEIASNPIERLDVSKPKKYAAVVMKQVQFTALQARLAAVYLKEKEDIEASHWGVLATQVLLDTEPPPIMTGLERVLAVVLENLPIPDEQTPWERIFEYRSDHDSRSKFLALRKWMRTMAKSSLPRREINEELEYLLNDYRSHMNLHRIKARTGTLEMLVVTTAEILENLVAIKWSEAAKKLFSVRQRRIALMEAEMKAPGREVAFIADAHEKFGG